MRFWKLNSNRGRITYEVALMLAFARLRHMEVEKSSFSPTVSV